MTQNKWHCLQLKRRNQVDSQPELGKTETDHIISAPKIIFGTNSQLMEISSFMKISLDNLEKKYINSFRKTKLFYSNYTYHTYLRVTIFTSTVCTD